MKKINYLFALIATVFVLGMTSCDPNENSVAPANPLEEFVGTYTLTSSMSGTDEILPSNPAFETGNDQGQSSKHFSFILNADGTGSYIGHVATEPMTWELGVSKFVLTYYGTKYTLNVSSHSSNELVATYSGNVNTYNIN